jgi:RNA polymerase sigma-70 factor, ECF subfamily
VSEFARRLRTPEERVGMLPNASLPPPIDARTDEDALLLRALAERDESAFGECIDRFYPIMHRLARQHVDDDGAAEEVVQETWLAALNGIAAFEGRSLVKTWLFHILRNIARRRGRRDARLRPMSDIANATSPDAAATDPLDRVVAAGEAHGHEALWGSRSDPEADMLASELQDRIDAAIAALPPRLRDIIVLRDVEGRSAAEVCNILGISDTNQRVTLHRARDRVTNELRDYLGSNGCCDDLS